jgi:hypothetical protein
MIRKRISNQRRSERASPQPRRRRIKRIPSPSLPSDERDLSDDDLAAALRRSQLGEARRVRDAIRREIGGDIMSIVRESLQNMNSKAGRRRVLRLLHCRLGVPLEKIQKELGIE